MLTRLHIGIDYQFCFSFILQISFYWRGCCQSGAVQRNIEYLIKNKYLWSKTKILTTQRKVRAHYLLNCPNTTAAAAAFADDYLWWRWSYWHVIPFFPPLFFCTWLLTQPPPHALIFLSLNNACAWTWWKTERRVNFVWL